MADQRGFKNRTEYAAARIAELVEAGAHGARLGTKQELREICAVSVGTFNEAIKLAQSRGIIELRPGPGGGIFVAEPSASVRLGNSMLGIDGDETTVADAMRLRNALDPLLVEDALRHSSLSDVDAMRACLDEMTDAVTAGEPRDFIRANWALHRAIARVSPSAILRSFYLSLLDIIEVHTLSVHETDDEPLDEYISARLSLHMRLVDAIEDRDHALAARLVTEHNTSVAVAEPATSAGNL